jgi:hypothetical protein
MTLRFLSAIVAAAMLSVGCSDDNDSIATGPTSTSTDTTTVSVSNTPQGGCSLPSAPSNLQVASITGTTVVLTWSPVAGAIRYAVMVGTTPGGSNVLFNESSQASISFTAPDGRSYARVEASTACGNGPATGSISFVVPG